jgi:hypothetical protein
MNQPSLRPLDLPVALHLASRPEEGSETVAEVFGIGLGSAHRTVQCLMAAELVLPHRRAIVWLSADGTVRGESLVPLAHSSWPARPQRSMSCSHWSMPFASGELGPPSQCRRSRASSDLFGDPRTLSVAGPTPGIGPSGAGSGSCTEWSGTISVPLIKESGPPCFVDPSSPARFSPSSRGS